MTHPLLTGRRTVLFDFDGLLCDTERATHRSWADFYAQHGQVLPASLWRRMAGRPAGGQMAADDLAHRIGRRLGDTEVATRKAVKRRLCDEEPLRPGVAALLAFAHDNGVATAVVSSSDREWVRHHLHRLAVLDAFDLVVTGDDAVHHKPAPDLYLTALHRLGHPCTDALALEDSAVGVRAARAAGIDCVAIPNAVGTPDELGQANLVVDSIEALLPLPEQPAGA